MNVAVILVAAGGGARLGAGIPKAFALLCGESILAHALRGVLDCPEVGHVIVVSPASHLEQSHAVVGDVVGNNRQSRGVVGGDRESHGVQGGDRESRGVVGGDRESRSVAGDNRQEDANPGGDVRVDVVAGGVDRSASVAAGLAALRTDDGIVLVHDVARPLAPPDLFARVIRAVRGGHPAVIPGLAVTDTVKVVDAQGRVLATPDRGSLRGIQTPQGFLREVLEHAYASGLSATDDAGLVERMGGHVRVVDGDPQALKITSPLDLAVATALLQDGHHGG